MTSNRARLSPTATALLVGVGIAVSGLALLAAAFLYDVFFAGIPYQDPPADLQARYTLDQQVASAVGWLGAALLAGATPAGLVTWAVLRRRS